MKLNILRILFFIIIFFSLNGCANEFLIYLWYFFRFILLSKLYSHIGIILILLEIISLISLALLLIIITNLKIRLRFFFLFLCLIVGEASLGLRLLVISSRFQSKELLSNNIL